MNDGVLELPTPCLVIDLPAVDNNIAAAASAAEANRAMLRPHFKAHKSSTLMLRQLAGGRCTGATVATAHEAEVLLAAGVTSVLIANELVDRSEVASVVRLAANAEVVFTVDSAWHVDMLASVAHEVDTTIDLAIELDVGMGRCGIRPSDDQALKAVVGAIRADPHLSLVGLVGYNGYAAAEQDRDRRQLLASQSAALLQGVRDQLQQDGQGDLWISGGGTGDYHESLSTGTYDEVQCGSYVLMDAAYSEHGLPFRQAVFAVASVISTPSSSRAILNIGLKGLSLEKGLPRAVGPGIQVVQLHDEHAVCRIAPTRRKLSIGDRVLLVPSHLDPSINLHPGMWVIGDGGVHYWSTDGRR